MKHASVSPNCVGLMASRATCVLRPCTAQITLRDLLNGAQRTRFGVNGRSGACRVPNTTASRTCTPQARVPLATRLPAYMPRAAAASVTGMASHAVCRGRPASCRLRPQARAPLAVPSRSGCRSGCPTASRRLRSGGPSRSAAARDKAHPLPKEDWIKPHLSEARLGLSGVRERPARGGGERPAGAGCERGRSRGLPRCAGPAAPADL
jgi:hypothetical protein